MQLRIELTSSSFLCVGTLAAGHLQTQLEAATWTLLSGRIMHLLCFKGRIQSKACNLWNPFWCSWDQPAAMPFNSRLSRPQGSVSLNSKQADIVASLLFQLVAEFLLCWSLYSLVPFILGLKMWCFFSSLRKLNTRFGGSIGKFVTKCQLLYIIYHSSMPFRDVLRARSCSRLWITLSPLTPNNLQILQNFILFLYSLICLFAFYFSASYFYPLPSHFVCPSQLLCCISYVYVGRGNVYVTLTISCGFVYHCMSDNYVIYGIWFVRPCSGFPCPVSLLANGASDMLPCMIFVLFDIYLFLILVFIIFPIFFTVAGCGRAGWGQCLKNSSLSSWMWHLFGSHV